MFNPVDRIKEVMSCKNCEWLIINPNENLGECQVCLNCGKEFNETHSIIESVERVENGIILTTQGNKY